MKHYIFLALAVLAFAACQRGAKHDEVNRMSYTVPATEFTPAMEAEYYTGPVTTDSVPDGQEGYILYKADQSCYMGEFRNGYPVPQLEADSFMMAKAKEGIYTRTESGLLYRELQAGSGARPTAESTVVFHYEGKLPDGTVFDSSYQRGDPLTGVAGQMVKGFTEALTMMPTGAKWEVVIPFHLAYGVRGSAGSIPQYAPLVFTLELISVK